MPGERVKTRDAVHFVAEELDPNRDIVLGARLDFDRVSAHAEFSSSEINVVALVKHVHEFEQ